MFARATEPWWTFEDLVEMIDEVEATPAKGWISMRRDHLVLALLAIAAAAIVPFALFAFRPTPDEPNAQSAVKNYPIENDPTFRPMLEGAEREAQKEFAKFAPHRLGSIHLFWDIKKQILKEKYGIDWRTPAEMNPKIKFD